MKICAKEARRLKLKIEFRRLMEKMKKRCLGLPGAVRSLRTFQEVGGGFGKKNLQGLGKALKWKVYYFIGFSAQALTLGLFFIQTNTFQGWDPPTFPRILRFNFSYETDF